jgi:hypothetical protein
VRNFNRSRFRGGRHVTKSTNHGTQTHHQKTSSRRSSTIGSRLTHKQQTTNNKQPNDFWTIYIQQAFHYTSSINIDYGFYHRTKNHHQISNTKEVPLQSHNDNSGKGEDDHEDGRREMG